MPHCIIEYSKPLEELIAIDELLKTVHRGALASGLFEEADIKTRAIAYANFQIGTDEANTASFAHITIRLLSGRSDTQKSNASRAVLQAVADLNAPIDSITVEVVEMPKGAYLKRLLP